MTLADKLLERGEDEIEERYGFVLMLDGLGVSSLGQAEQKEWILNRNSMIAELAKQQEFHLRESEQRFEKSLQSVTNQNMQPERQISHEIYIEIHKNSSFVTFGDTIIFHGSVPTRYDTPEHRFTLISQITFTLHEIMKANIKYDLRLRGSFALGNFLVASKSNTIMGKALIDAYNSYENANWIGIIAAPGETETILKKAFSVADGMHQSVAINELAGKSNLQDIDVSLTEHAALVLRKNFVKYPVPYRNKNDKADNKYKPREGMLTPNWPITLHMNPMTPESIIHNPISNKPLADKVFLSVEKAKKSSDSCHHEKYDNTIAFYNDIWERRREFLNQNPNLNGHI